MHDPIAYLVKQGFETIYVSCAIDILKHRTSNWKQPSQYIEEIYAVLNERVEQDRLSKLTYFEARYLYFYVVQNLLLANKKHTSYTNEDLIKQSLAQSSAFCQQHKTALEEERREMGISVVGTTRIRTGTKTEQALEIFREIIEGHDVEDKECRERVIQRFQQELNMERSGALTYYHATKKRYLDS